MARHTLFALPLLLMLAASGLAQEAQPYREPDLELSIFGGELRLDPAEQRAAATLLARYVRNELKFAAVGDYATAAKLLGIALRLDPTNKQAVIVNGTLKAGRKPAPEDDPRWTGKECMAQIRRCAAVASRMPGKPDKMLAAYLYSALITLQTTDDDVFELEMLAKVGIKPDWRFAAPAAAGTGAATVDTPPSGDNVTRQIRGLVVVAMPDGRMRGKVMEIIAAPGAAVGASTGSGRYAYPSSGPRLVTTVGPDMRVSFDEAIRLVQLRKAGAASRPLEVSFGDKYTAKDGGSAGAAFALLILSAAGGVDIASDIAITGDITVDGKIRTVSSIGAKIRGAAADGCACVAIPAINANQVNDMVLLGGADVLWPVQIFSMATIDDAIAVMRKDRSPKLVEAMKLFDELRDEWSKKPPAFLNDSPAKEKLARIRALAPNHLSAECLQALAERRNPQKMTLTGTLSEAMVAIGPMRHGLTEYTPRPEIVTQDVAISARNNLQAVKKVADPGAMPFIQALEAFCASYYELAVAEEGRSYRAKTQARETFTLCKNAVKPALEKVASDPRAADKLLRE